MEQNENVHPETVGATPRPEEMIGAGLRETPTPDRAGAWKPWLNPAIASMRT